LGMIKQAMPVIPDRFYVIPDLIGNPVIGAY
jgi:hypothetical protein